MMMKLERLEAIRNDEKAEEKRLRDTLNDRLRSLGDTSKDMKNLVLCNSELEDRLKEIRDSFDLQTKDLMNELAGAKEALSQAELENASKTESLDNKSQRVRGIERG